LISKSRKSDESETYLRKSGKGLRCRILEIKKVLIWNFKEQKIGKGVLCMEFKKYEDVKIFYKDTYEILMRHEAQNLIPLGNIIIGNAGEDTAGWRNPANWFMAPLLTEKN